MTTLATMREKTDRLQAQFICPIWTVWFGKSVNLYFTQYHADQMMRALRNNGTEAHCFASRPQYA